MSGLIPVTARPDMFRAARRHYAIPEGVSLAELVEITAMPPEFWELGHIEVGGMAVPREHWRLVRPRAGRDGREIAVTLAMVPGKGMGGTAGLLTILASVAVVVATAGIGAGALAPILGAGFAYGTIGAAVTAAAVGVAGSMLISALAPPPQTGNRDTRKSRTIAGIGGNALQPLDFVPGVLGTISAPPPLVAPPYVRFTRGRTYAHAIVGFAGRLEVEDVKVNGTPADDLDGIEYEVREGDPSDTQLTLITDTGIEHMSGGVRFTEFDLSETDDPLSVLEDQTTPANSYPDWIGFTSRGVPDEMWFRIQFPSGLLQTAESTGDRDPGGVPFRMRLRRRGETTWINLPEFHFTDDTKQSREIRQRIYLKWEAGTDSAGFDPQRNAYAAFWLAGSGQPFEWEADAYFDTGLANNYAGNVHKVRDGFDVFLDPDIFPPDVYEVQIIRGLGYDRGNFDANAYTYGGVAADANFFEHVTIAGPEHIVTINQKTMTSLAILEQVTTFSFDYPMAAPAQMPTPLTLIAVKAKNLMIESITATFTSKVGIWDGTNWATVAASRNPAALYRHVLTGALSAKPLPNAMLDNDALVEWYDFCEDRGYECNAVISDNLPLVLQMIAAAGFASPRMGEKFGVVIERDRTAESIGQNFSPLNSRGFSSSKSFDTVPHAIWAEFHDEADDYKIKQELVYQDGRSTADAWRTEGVSYLGITDRHKVIERATLDLRQMLYRATQRSCEVSVESLLSGRGDLVGLTHPTIIRTVDSGWVAEVLFGGGGNVTGVRLYNVMRLAAIAGSVTAAIRLMDGTVLDKPIDETANTDTLTFTTPFSMPVDGDGAPLIAAECLVVTGPAAEVYRRAIVLTMDPQEDFGAEITFVDEAPEIHYPARAVDLVASINVHDEILLEWYQPRQSTVSHADIYRGSTNVFGSATLIDTVLGAPGVAKSYADAPVDGTWFYWVVPHDNDGHSGDEMRVEITGGYDAATVAILERFDELAVPATSARGKLYNDLVEALKSAGVWSKLDCLYLLAAHAAAAGRVNLKTPGTIDLGEANSPAFAVDAGYTGNGSNARLNSTFNPSTAGGNWALNSATLFVWCNTSAAAANTTSVLAGVSAGGVNAFITTRNSADNAVAEINVNTATTTAANTDGSGYYAIIRDGASSVRFRKNNTSLATDTDASTSLPNGVVRVLCSSTTASTHTTKEAAAAGWGASLSNAESDALYAALNTYLAAL